MNCSINKNCYFDRNIEIIKNALDSIDEIVFATLIVESLATFA